MGDRGFGRAKGCGWPFSLAACLALLATASAAAADSDDENARRHFESGAAYLDQSDYDDALREFQSAYNLSKRPALLLNIATVNERMGKLQGAIDSLTKFLAEDPQTSERTTIETRIANLKKRLETEQAATAPPAPPAPTAPAAAAPPPPTPTPPAPPPAPPAKPNRTGAYIAWSAGGAAAIGAVVTGLVAKGKYDDASSSCAHNCPDDTVKPIKTMALVSDVLTGAAVVGAGVGVVLFLTAKPSSVEKAGVPRLSAAVLPGSGSVEATWRF